MTGMDADPSVDERLDAAVDELYGLPGDGFLPRRAQLAAAAKAGGDAEVARAITALRKPTIAAWAVNLLVRKRPDEVDRLSDLAARLRRAQERLDGPTLLDLGRERTALVDALVGATAAVVTQAGARFTPAMARDVGTTFVAALASSEATAAVTSGRLTRAIEYAGFGEIDLTEATARPLRLVRPDERASAAASAGTLRPGRSTAASAGTPPLSERTAGDPATGDEDARDPALTAAEAALHDAMAAATAATARHGVLAAELELAENRVAQLQAELARARAHRDKTADALGEADSAQAATQRELRRARAVVEDLRGS
jgi:hypothetical protein